MGLSYNRTSAVIFVAAVLVFMLSNYFSVYSKHKTYSLLYRPDFTSDIRKDGGDSVHSLAFDVRDSSQMSLGGGSDAASNFEDNLDSIVDGTISQMTTQYDIPDQFAPFVNESENVMAIKDIEIMLPGPKAIQAVAHNVKTKQANFRQAATIPKTKTYSTGAGGQQEQNRHNPSKDAIKLDISRSTHIQTSNEKLATFLPANKLPMRLVDSQSGSDVGAWERKAGGSGGKEVIKVGAYDQIDGFQNWMWPDHRAYARKHCSTDCVFVPGRGQAGPQLDAVLFHAKTHQKGSLPSKSRRPGVPWLMVNMEPYLYVKNIIGDRHYMQKHFDLTADYTTKSDVPLLYGPRDIYPEMFYSIKPLPFSQKDGFGQPSAVSAFTSNCKNAGAEERTAFLGELMKYVPVHSYGRCHNNRHEVKFHTKQPHQTPVQVRQLDKITTMRRYKFYFSFENRPLVDYVSEKVYQGLRAGALPIYVGAPNADAFLPHHPQPRYTITTASGYTYKYSSVLDATGLTAKQVGGMVKELSRNESLYNEIYMSWRDQPAKPQFVDAMANSSYVPHTLCRVCEAVRRYKHGLIPSRRGGGGGSSTAAASPQSGGGAAVSPSPYRRSGRE